MPQRISDRQYQAKRARDELRWMTVKNTESAIIPPYSFVKIVDVDRDGTHYVAKVTTDGDKLVLVTWELSILGDGTGEGTIDFPWWVEYDTGDGTPARGEHWGPAAGSYKAKKNKQGFLAIPMKDSAIPPYSADHSLVYLGLEYCRP